MHTLYNFLQSGALGNFTWGHLVMLTIGCLFIYLAVKKDYEPLLLIPIGFGILIGNIPFSSGMRIGVYEEGSVLQILYQGVTQGWYPPLIFLGIGAMTDFSAMLSNPRLILLGAAAQAGIFLTLIGALALGFNDMRDAAAIAIIGGADGPTAIFIASKLAPHHLGAIAIAAYSYMALVPVIQPPIIKLLTSKKERLIRMKPSRPVSKRVRIIFPIVAFLATAFAAPASKPAQGIRRNGAPRQDRQELVHRCDHHSPWFDSGHINRCYTISYARLDKDFRARRLIVCCGYGCRCDVR